VSNPHIAYHPRPDATPQGELNALAAVYRFILFKSRSANRKAAEPAPGTGEDATKSRTQRKEDGMS